MARAAGVCLLLALGAAEATPPPRQEDPRVIRSTRQWHVAAEHHPAAARPDPTRVRWCSGLIPCSSANSFCNFDLFVVGVCEHCPYYASSVDVCFKLGLPVAGEEACRTKCAGKVARERRRLQDHASGHNSRKLCQQQRHIWSKIVHNVRLLLTKSMLHASFLLVCH